MTEQTTTTKLSDWLDQFDSHSVYDAHVLDDCPIDGAKDIVPMETAEAVACQIKARGLDGWLDTDASLLVTGYTMAEALGTKVLGGPGSWTRYQGRGSRFRAVIGDLRDAGL